MIVKILGLGDHPEHVHIYECESAFISGGNTNPRELCIYGKNGPVDKYKIEQILLGSTKHAQVVFFMENGKTVDKVIIDQVEVT